MKTLCDEETSLLALVRSIHIKPRLSEAEIARYLGVAFSSITRAIEKMLEGTGGKINAPNIATSPKITSILKTKALRDLVV